MTVDELVLCFSRLKDSASQGESLNQDLMRMESAIMRLCKESDFDDALMNLFGYRRYGGGTGLYREKNSYRETGSRVLKRKSEDVSAT